MMSSLLEFEKSIILLKVFELKILIK